MLRRARTVATGYAMHVFLPGIDRAAAFFACPRFGLSLAAMIREDKEQAITCSDANLEEDVYNLVAHDYYERVPHYRYLTAADERALLERKLNRVTDTCIPEEEAMRRVESSLLGLWKSAAARGERRFPHQYFYELLCDGTLAEHYQIDRPTPGEWPRQSETCPCSSPAGRTRRPATCSRCPCWRVRSRDR